MASFPTGKLRCDIFDVVKLKKMASVWRKLTRGGCSRARPPSDVPPGHVAVLVGEDLRRFVIRADYLNQPAFRQLLAFAYEEYGHQHDGPLAIPCHEFLFRDIISSLQCGAKGSLFSCYCGDEQINLNKRDSTPLLQWSTRRSTC
ncbi:hypothetical protein SAY87_009006 [Trapa incisa]|uniref:Uncharacterized protein n=2 Tax=Trapa TaxID=22665 RepID=A0AAN7RB23_TRANT|nr:hypothetical protein SAY87_009006 [Trapa incisa]KAK4798589.1 hypothetical protein SAY86_030915 [Trapa natans]